MKSMRVPFRIEGGRVVDTRSSTQIMEQKIINVLTTGKLERVGNPMYGSGVTQLAFEPVDALVETDFKTDAVADLQRYVSNINVADIRFTTTEETTSQVTVYYRPPLAGMRTVTVNLVNSGDLTEESPLI